MVMVVLLCLGVEYWRHTRAAAKAFERSEELHCQAREGVPQAFEGQQLQFARYQTERVCKDTFLAAFLIVLALGWHDLETAVTVGRQALGH